MLIIRDRYGLEAETVRHLKEATDGRTGVELVASNGEEIYYSGK